MNTVYVNSRNQRKLTTAIRKYKNITTEIFVPSLLSVFRANGNI